VSVNPGEEGLGELSRAVLPELPAVLYVATPPPERRLLEVTEGADVLLGRALRGAGEPADAAEAGGPGEAGGAGAAGQAGPLPRSLSSVIHPDDRERVEEEIEEGLAESGSYSVYYRIAPEADASGSGATLMSSERSRWVWDQGQLVQPSADSEDGAERPEEEIQGAGEERVEPHLRGMLLDITELKSVEDRAVQGQRKEALGALAGSVAQEFNDLLTAIYGSLDLALEQRDDPRAVQDEVRLAVRAVERARFLTEQLVSFTRARPQRPRVEDPNELVEKMKPLIESVAGASVRTVLALDPHGSRARFDPGLLEQAVMNLVLNAREAMGEEGGRLLVSTGDVVFDEGDLRRGDEVRPGRYSTITISDTGPGVDESVRRRIYEPFFSTKEGHTGLGLSAAFGIVRQMGGIIRLRSNGGQGTRATIYLPEAEQAAGEQAEAIRGLEEGAIWVGSAHGAAGSAQDELLEDGLERAQDAASATDRDATDAPATGSVGSDPAEPADTDPRHPARILLVEDDDAVRRLLVRILGREDYEVMEAASAEEALALAEESDRELDLLFTDVMLPGMRGPELVRCLRSDQPGLRVVVTSGFPDDEELRSEGLPEAVVFLGKPFSVGDVFEVVAEALAPERLDTEAGPSDAREAG